MPKNFNLTQEGMKKTEWSLPANITLEKNSALQHNTEDKSSMKC